MKSIKNQSERLLFGLIFTFHQIAVSKYGLALFPDSVNYIHAARTFLQQTEFHQFTGEYFVSWPPLYSILLSFQFPNTNYFDIVSRITHGISIALTQVIFYKIIQTELIKDSKSPIQNKILAFLLSFSAWPLLQLSFEYVSEVYFNLFVIAGFYLTFTKEKWGLGILFFILASIQRYIGGLFLACSLFLLFFEMQNKRKWIFFVILSFLPLSLWIVRNWFLTQSFTGVRSEPFLHPLSNAYIGFEVITKWIFPHFLPDFIRFSLFILLFGVSIGIVFKNRIKPILEDNKIKSYSFFYFVAYILSLWVISSSGKSEALSFRMLAPAYPFLMLFLVSQISSFPQNWRNKVAFFYLIIALWQSIFLYRIGLNRIQFGAGGFNSNEWKNAHWLSWYESNATDSTIISNAPDAVYALFGKQLKSTPFQSDWNLYQKKEAKNPTTILWIKLMNRKTLVPIDSLVQFHQLEIVIDDKDYSVWSNRN